MNFETKYIWESLPLLLQGLQLTILISMVGLAGGFIIGLLAGVCRALGGGIAKTLSLIFVELIRGTPIMVQVMFIYFALPMILPVRIDPITAAMVTIIINSGAYMAEITRGAILSINRGFKEASLAISDYIERVLCKTIRQLIIAGVSSTAVSHTRRARFTVTRQKTSALTSEDIQALRDHLRCQVPVDNMG